MSEWDAFYENSGGRSLPQEESDETNSDSLEDLDEALLFGEESSKDFQGVQPGPEDLSSGDSGLDNSDSDSDSESEGFFFRDKVSEDPYFSEDCTDSETEWDSDEGSSGLGDLSPDGI